MPHKVVVAMSGGVDSSVAAALLKEQGHEVIGVTLRLSNWEESEGKKFGGCCGSKDFYDARSVAQALDIPHYAFDYVNNFRDSVITYFKDSYQAGETPNPCIACNQFVKFDRLLEQATALGADYLATGHYARVQSSVLSPRSFLLKKAIDSTKDQSYVLYHLRQEQLSRVMFPLGDYKKSEIREIARRYQLRTAEKPDSQEICFVPNEDHRAFLREEISPQDRPSGPIRHKNGQVLGTHEGLPFYTVGQRQGLGIAVGRPLYVVALEPETNTLVVGEKTDVYSQSVRVRNVSWVGGKPASSTFAAHVKIRYKHSEAHATLTLEEESFTQVVFDEPQSAVTPGQAAVFYDGDVVIGGGVIDHAIDN
jgi:tRNA-specific 2-thiouridylase